MTEWLVGILILVALVIGVVGNRWWSVHDESSSEGLGVSDLVTPLTTLAVVLLAFIMVEAISSYGRPGSSSGPRRGSSTRWATTPPASKTRRSTPPSSRT